MLVRVLFIYDVIASDHLPPTPPTFPIHFCIPLIQSNINIFF